MYDNDPGWKRGSLSKIVDFIVSWIVPSNHVVCPSCVAAAICERICLFFTREPHIMQALTRGLNISPSARVSKITFFESQRITASVRHGQAPVGL